MSVKTEMVPPVVKYPKKGGWNYYNRSLSTDTVSDSDGLAGMELSNAYWNGSSVQTGRNTRLNSVQLQF